MASAGYIKVGEVQKSFITFLSFTSRRLIDKRKLFVYAGNYFTLLAPYLKYYL